VVVEMDRADYNIFQYKHLSVKGVVIQPPSTFEVLALGDEARNNALKNVH